MSDQQVSLAQHPEKVSTINNATECLLEISQRPFKHVFLSPGEITPYDAYATFIETCKREIQPEIIHHLIPGSDSNFPIEKILTPTYYCSLAYTQLKKLLDIEKAT